MQGQLVSIIVPTYNRAHLIAETIQSVVDQTYKNWELIIVDDGSADGTRKKVNEFNDKRIQYFHVAHSGILGKVRNTGINYAKGDYIAFLDSDDLWLPQKLEHQLLLLKDHPQASFVFGMGEEFGPRATIIPEPEPLFVGNVYLAQLMEERFLISPTTFLFKKEVLNTTGQLDEQLSGSDNDFFFRMAWSFEGIFCGEKLARLRKHNENISLEREMIFLLEHIQVVEKLCKEGKLTRRQFNHIASKQYYTLGLLCIRTKKAGKAIRFFLNFNKLKPINYKGWLRLGQSILKYVF